jgi:hypothetical protein
VEVSDRDLLIALKMKLRDRDEHMKTVINQIDRHLSGTDAFDDPNLRVSIKHLCEKFQVNYFELLRFAQHMYDGPQGGTNGIDK